MKSDEKHINEQEHRKKIDENEVPKKKKSKLITALIFTSLVILVSGVLVGIGLLWQWSVSFLAICNAFYFSASILVTFSVIVYAANNNIFSPLVYGTKTFFLMFVAKRPKLSYFDYVQETKKNPIPKIYVFFPFIASLPSLVVAITLHIIYNIHIYPYL